MVIVDGRVAAIDTIEWQGALWLVPTWLDRPDEGWTAPERLIRLDTLRVQKMLTWPHRPNFCLTDPLPKDVYEGRVPPEQAARYEVIEHPAIRIELPQLH